MSHIVVNTTSVRDCTIGILTVLETGFRCFTLELPWLNNVPSQSCIPSGIYRWEKHESPSLGPVIHILDVQDRTWIYIHKGNYTSQIEGCILVGTMIKDINGDGTPDVGNSTAAFDELMQQLPKSGKITVQRNTMRGV